MKRFWLIIVSTILLTLLMTACGAFGAGGDEGIKIGMMAQLSGPASFLGPSEEAAARIAVEEINAQGGLLGEQVELIMCDTATDADTANACAKRLLNDDNVDALFAATTSASREAVSAGCGTKRRNPLLL